MLRACCAHHQAPAGARRFCTCVASTDTRLGPGMPSQQKRPLQPQPSSLRQGYSYSQIIHKWGNPWTRDWGK